MVKKKPEETLHGTEKEFLDIFRSLCHSRSTWQVWADMIGAIACSLSNALDRTAGRYEQREKEYEECIKRLGSVETVSQLFAVLTIAFDNNPDQDFLGKMYMSLELSNHWKGQYFTPYNVCRMMADMIIDQKKAQDEVKRSGYLSINDPACGAGATLIAVANSIRRSGINYQEHVLFGANDIDRVTAQMCYIQLSLLGCPGYVAVANTLSNPLTGDVLEPLEKEGQEFWYTPMFFSKTWRDRRMLKKLRRMIGGQKTETGTVPELGEQRGSNAEKVIKEAATRIVKENADQAVKKMKYPKNQMDGQLSLFDFWGINHED